MRLVPKSLAFLLARGNIRHSTGSGDQLYFQSQYCTLLAVQLWCLHDYTYTQSRNDKLNDEHLYRHIIHNTKKFCTRYLSKGCSAQCVCQKVAKVTCLSRPRTGSCKGRMHIAQRAVAGTQYILIISLGDICFYCSAAQGCARLKNNCRLDSSFNFRKP